MQIDVVSVRFLRGNNEYFFSPNGNTLSKGDYVIVDTEKGKDLVLVVSPLQKIDASVLSEPLKNVIRKATEKEFEEAQENNIKAEALLPEIKKTVREHQLEMKVVSVESNYNYTKLTINFTAENRVDFRDLVKQLAEKYKIRIELRQIGPRDCTRILGGFGPCGKEVCCHQGIGVNDHVSIKMAKNQGLSLNPNSISGLCNKLLCCLSYENGYYAEVLKEMPKQNSFVHTPDGEGKVIYCDLLKKKVDVRFQNENNSEIKSYDLAQLKFKKETDSACDKAKKN